ncbi:MAG TPA: penicillin acylase family protein [Polyangiaceae bacterium]|jgi:penicillin amidase
MTRFVRRTCFAGFPAIAVTVALAACGHSKSGSSAPPSLGPFGSTPAVTNTTQIANLTGPVDVLRDHNGLVHIWATNPLDALRVEGYQIAKDRTAQLELVRRSAEGRTAELLGDADPGLIDQDIAMRMIGLKRVAQQMYDALAPDSEAKADLDAYADGISQFNARIQTGDESLPKSMIGIGQSAFEPWTGADCVAIARFEEWNLAYTADDEIALTQFADSARTAFPSSSSRAGFLVDTIRFAPLDPTLSMPGGFPDDTSHTMSLPITLGPGGVAGARALGAPRATPPGRSLRTPSVSPAVLDAAGGFVTATRARRDAMARLGFRGSNDWIVAPSRTATGHAMLANDPHLSLSAPSVFWIVQIDAHDPSSPDTSKDIHVEGTAFPGIPGIILGFNQNIAWGATTADYDVTDVYSETLTPDGSGVVFNGQSVPFQTVTEEIAVAGQATPLEYDVLVVPQHGPIVPTIVNHAVVPPDPTKGALSVKWTGSTPTNELPAVLTGFLRATGVEDFRTAIRDFAVGAQNWVVADTAGNIFYTTQSQIPLRVKAAYTWDPKSFSGTLPCFVEPGDGSAEWTGQYLDEAFVPHVKNPSQGYVGTANGDQVGDTLNNDPSSATLPNGQPIYMACFHDPGYRVGRIHSLIENLGHPMALTDMATIQADARSPLGAALAPGLVTSLEHAMAEAATPGTHPDLTAVVASARYGAANVQELHDLLVQWGSQADYDTPPGVSLDDGSLVSDDTVPASEATLVFDTWMMRMPIAVLGDEQATVGQGTPYDPKIVLAYLMTATPSSLATYDPTAGDSVLFDDTTTATVTETRDERSVTSLLDAVDFLNTKLGTDRTKWRWGVLHTLRFNSLVSLWEALSIPPVGDSTFPNGFPRHGDGFNIDVAEPDSLPLNLSDATFTYSEGPTQRFVIDMDPGGPVPFNVLPGGEVWDNASPHFADEAELWRRNQNHPLWFTQSDVAANVEERDQYTP